METFDGYDKVVWKQLSEELGLTALPIPEAYGGSGFGLVELGIVLEEMGRVLLCAPYFSSTVLATHAILNAGDESQKRTLLPKLASGEMTATVAVTEPNGLWGSDGIDMIARPESLGYRLSGEKSFVLDGHSAELLVVIARQPGTHGDKGLSFLIVPCDASGLERRLLSTIGPDPTRKLAHLTFKEVSAEPLVPLGAGAQPRAKTRQQAIVALTNEMVGGAARLFESAIDYTKLRMQFGRVIGPFQAMKHTCFVGCPISVCLGEGQGSKGHCGGGEPPVQPLADYYYRG